MVNVYVCVSFSFQKFCTLVRSDPHFWLRSYPFAAYTWSESLPLGATSTNMDAFEHPLLNSNGLEYTLGNGSCVELNDHLHTVPGPGN